MAISINRVYQKVLALANKEQRGYITPREFNLFADHAQMEIFEQYFYDLNQFIRTPGNNTGHSDMVTNLEEKISLFEVFNYPVFVRAQGELLMSDIERLYRIENIKVKYQNEPNTSQAEEIQLNELKKYGSSPLGTWTTKRPVYIRYKGAPTQQLSVANVGGANPIGAIKIYPFPEPATLDPLDATQLVATDKVAIDFIQKPRKPLWSHQTAGVLFANGVPLYNSTTSIDFELHPSDETELVYRILTLAGIAIEKPELTQSAAGLGAGQIQQEKQ